MKIIFLGAGDGTRLHPYTQEQPKWMLTVRGVPLLQALVGMAHKTDVTEVVVVRGTKGGNVLSPSVVYVDNLDGGNMVHSLFKAEAHLTDEVIVSYADILYEPRVLEELKTSDAAVSVVVDLDWQRYYAARNPDPMSIAESLVLQDHKILEIGQPIRKGSVPHGQYIGLVKFTSKGVTALRETYHDLFKRHSGHPWRNAQTFERAYMTDLLQELIDRGVDVRAVPIHSGWVEFDTASDYESVLSLDAQGRLSTYIALEHLPKNPSVLSAGGVVVRPSETNWEVLLVGDGRSGCWRLPKGMQEPTETILQTAVREVTEETGIEADSSAYVGRASWTYEYGGNWWDEYVHFYLMRPIRASSRPPDGEFSAAEWFPVAASAEQLLYESERQIVNRATTLIGPHPHS